ARLLRVPREWRAGCHAYLVADAVPPRSEGLFPHLRKLLRGYPLLDAVADRGDRHGQARPAQRGLPDFDGSPQGQDRGRLQYGPASVHAGVRAPLAGLDMEGEAVLPRSILFLCGMNAI